MSQQYQLTGKSEQICERCANKKAEFVCSLCQPLKYFCGTCDIAVHTIITKKSHQRVQVGSQSQSPIVSSSILLKRNY